MLGYYFWKWLAVFFVQVTCGTIFKLLNLVSRLTGGIIFFRLEVVGAENVRKLKGSFIITPIHKSYLDPLLYIAAIPLTLYFRILPVRILAKEWLFHIAWYKGGLVLRCGLLFSGCYRLGKSLKDLRCFLRFAFQELKKGRPVVLYPEGGIRTGPGISPIPIGNGAAFLAKTAGVPILPIAICGAELLSARDFFFGKRIITVVFGKPFRVDRKSRSKEVTKEIRQRWLEIYTVGG